MTANLNDTIATPRYARAVAASKKARWEIDADVIRGRSFDPNEKFLPDALSLAPELEFLDAAERRFLSRVQGRTYANVFGLVERSSTPRCSSSASGTSSETRRPSKRWFASATKSSSTRSCSGASSA